MAKKLEEYSPEEVDALAALVESDGWRLFLAHVDDEWGPVAYRRKIDQAIAECRSNHEEVEGPICEIGATARGIELAAQWPVRILEALKKHRATHDVNHPALRSRLFQRRAH